MDQPLADLRVVEYATGVAGAYAGKLLADFGADVVKVEPSDGGPLRRSDAHSAALAAGEAPTEASGLHLHLDTNKRSIVLEPAADPADLRTLEALIGRADLLVESTRPGELEAFGLDAARLRALRPSLVRLSVTPFGHSGPYAGALGEEIVAYAMGGPMHATGSDEREPVKLAGDVVSVQCGSVAAVAGLAALDVAAAAGRPVWVDVANFETQAASIDRRMAYLMWHIFTGLPVKRVSDHRLGPIPVGIYPAEDGYVQIVLAPNWLARFGAMLDNDEIVERVTRPGWLDDPELPDLLDTAVHEWTLARAKQECMVEAQSRQLGITALNTTLDVLADEHFRSRGFWEPVDHLVAGRYETPGPPFRMADGWRLRRPAPLLDQHGAEIRAELADPVASAASAPPRPAGSPAAGPSPVGSSEGCALPLSGVRVLDLTVVWAGPYATMLLGDLGAEVIRVDNPNLYPTATRGAIPRPRPGHHHDLGDIWGAFPEDDPGERPWNRVGPFVIHARSKLGASLDLRTELGRETFLRLVERSDVLVENNSAKVLPRLGLDWAALHARNPRLIVLRMPSLGVHGPYADYIGFGAHVEALCGLTSLRGYPEWDLSTNTPTYHMDPASGAAGAFAVLAGLRRRRRTGVGELIELSQAENLLQHIGDHLVESSLSGQAGRSLGNRHPQRAPQGCYPCRGDDQWAVLSVGDDVEWRRLTEVMGSPAWALDDRFDTAAGRHAHHDELDRLLAGWTAGLTKHEVFERCRAARVTAGPVLDEADLLADPQLAARGFFRPNGSADVPEHLFPGHLWRWDGPPLAWGPINRLGGDNTYVYRDVLGLDDAEWAALDAEDHLNLDYVDADGKPL